MSAKWLGLPLNWKLVSISITIAVLPGIDAEAAPELHEVAGPVIVQWRNTFDVPPSTRLKTMSWPVGGVVPTRLIVRFLAVIPPGGTGRKRKSRLPPLAGFVFPEGESSGAKHVAALPGQSRT